MRRIFLQILCVVGVAIVGAVGASCPHGMVRVSSAVCMDAYEAPNVKGWRPFAFQSGTSAEFWCSGVDKRLCTENEWLLACRGPSNRPYPYGTTYSATTCNTNATWIPVNWTKLGLYPKPPAFEEAARLYQAEASGTRAGCVSELGVYDLTGNVAEWVRTSLNHTYDHVLKGCFWSGCFGGSPASCAFVNPAHPAGFRTYEAGARCCLDA